MSRSSSIACCNENLGLKKGPWTPEEDQKLLAYIEEHGSGNWRTLPEKAGLQRCGKSCRLRWINYLRPDVKRGKFSLQEEQTIIQLHAFLGNRWSAIAAHLPKRTDNEIKNYWNTHIKKRFTKLGIDPTTHKPKSDLLCFAGGGNGGGGGNQFRNTGTLSHMAQWERARLEAEARLVKESRKLSPAAPQPALSATRKRTKALVASPSRRSQCLDVLKAWQSVVTGMIGINTNSNMNLEPQPPTTFSDDNFSNPIITSAQELDLTAAAAGSLTYCNIGEDQQEDQLMMDVDRSNESMLPELNERFDDSTCFHGTTYEYQYWTAAAAGNMTEDFWGTSVHDFDYPMEQGSLH